MPNGVLIRKFFAYDRVPAKSMTRKREGAAGAKKQEKRHVNATRKGVIAK